jgi:hypothetical protein
MALSLLELRVLAAAPKKNPRRRRAGDMLEFADAKVNSSRADFAGGGNGVRLWAP